MCEANAFLVKEGEELLLMKSVDIIEPNGQDVWRLVDIFGEQKTVNGRIKGMKLVDHRIVFEE
jgi:predicted RNA-binding protein